MPKSRSPRTPATLAQIHQAYLPSEDLGKLCQDVLGHRTPRTAADEFRVKEHIKNKSARELVARARSQDIDFADLIR